MDVDNSLLQQIATDVLTGMLGMDITPGQANPPGTSGLIASIRISGDWQAGLEVLTPSSGARHIAEQMFGMTADELVEAEISDALGEIANMIGGNLKGLSQGETRLSLPCVGAISPQTSASSSERPMELHLKVGQEPLSLRLYQNAFVDLKN